MKKKLLAVLLTLTMMITIISPACAGISSASNSAVKTDIERTIKTVTAGTKNPSSGFDWFIMGMARSAQSFNGSSTYYKTYVKNIQSKLSSLNYPSDYSKTIITLTALGQDPTNIKGVNLIDKMMTELKDMIDNDNNDLFSLAYSLIALNTKENYSIPTSSALSEQDIIDKITALQSKEDNAKKGSFGYNDYSTNEYIASTDTTAMVLQALAPYYKTSPANSKVDECVELALEYLKSVQNDNGGFDSKEYKGTQYVDPNSTSQVLLALTELGKDPLKPENGFVKGDNNLYTALMSTYNSSTGNFKGFLYDDPNDWYKVTGFEDNKIATEQGLYTLVAYSRFLENKNSLYNMNDVTASLVAPDITAIKLNKSSVTITGIKKTTKVSVSSVAPSNAAKWYKWSSSNTKIAKVNSSGTITAIAPGSTTIKATSYDNTQSGKAVSASVKVTVKLAKPTYPKAKAGKKKVTVSFKKVSGAKKYEIYKKNSKGKWTKLKTTTKASFTDKKVKKGKRYSYCVKAVNGKYKSAASKTVKSAKVK